MTSNDQLVSRAFSVQSSRFDQLDKENKLTLHLRGVFREEVMAHANSSSHFLELNCGTGIDSIYFAQQGFKVHSTDNALGMLDKLNYKIQREHFGAKIETQLCSFNDLHKLGDKKFDYIISNFGGLNCANNLDMVLRQFKNHLNENGKITLVIMPKISPWEWLMSLKGDFKTAFRRSKKNAQAHIEGVHFAVYYYNPSYVIKRLKKDFNVLTLKGIYFAVPPEFYQNFVERYPKTYRLLQFIERKLNNYYPFNRWCDHYMITLQKK